MKHAAPVLWLLALYAGALLSGCETDSEAENKPLAHRLQFDPAQSDSLAVRLADEVVQAVGGLENFEAVKYLSFTFRVETDTGVVSEWRHDWDRQSNRYRLVGELPEGDPVLILLDLNSQQGQAYKNAAPANVEELRPLLGMAYSRYLSDTYWLLLPFKLKDPGAKLSYEERKQIAGKDYEVLRLSFIEKVGLTPENCYRVFIDPETNLVARWEYMSTGGAEPLGAWWEDWELVGGLKLAKQRRMETDERRRIIFDQIIASTEVDSSLFEPPAISSASAMD